MSRLHNSADTDIRSIQAHNRKVLKDNPAALASLFMPNNSPWHYTDYTSMLALNLHSEITNTFPLVNQLKDHLRSNNPPNDQLQALLSKISKLFFSFSDTKDKNTITATWGCLNPFLKEMIGDNYVTALNKANDGDNATTMADENSNSEHSGFSQKTHSVLARGIEQAILRNIRKEIALDHTEKTYNTNYAIFSRLLDNATQICADQINKQGYRVNQLPVLPQNRQPTESILKLEKAHAMQSLYKKLINLKNDSASKKKTRSELDNDPSNGLAQLRYCYTNFNRVIESTNQSIKEQPGLKGFWMKIRRKICDGTKQFAQMIGMKRKVLLSTKQTTHDMLQTVGLFKKAYDAKVRQAPPAKRPRLH